MIRGILFDKDGTLFDFNASWGRWARMFIDGYTDDAQKRSALAEAFMLDYEAMRFDPNSPIIAGTAQEMFRAVQSVFPNQTAPEIANAVSASTQSARMAPVCDLPSYLADLKARGLRLGIATNDDEKGTRSQLERHEALSYFDYVAGYDSGYGAKPAPGMCKGFLSTQDLRADEAIMVGDSAFDILAGKGAGMRTVGVLTGAASPDELADADVVFADITLIPDWIASLRQ